MCKLRHKVRNGQNIPRENQISSFFNFVFQIKISIFTLGFQKHIVRAQGGCRPQQSRRRGP